MQVVDEITGKLCPSNRCFKIVVKHLPESIVYGYSTRKDTIIPFYIYNQDADDWYESIGDKELLSDVLVFSMWRGRYFSKVGVPKNILIQETCMKGRGEFPYQFRRRYEAVENFELFNNKQVILNPKEYKFSPYLKYSFGLEFETSMGYIPEDICFRDGLIPLRDGSISGLEYSTVVMQGNDGISLLRQQLNTLRKYTAFNKECSLHIHIGGFKLSKEVIYRVYLLCRYLEGIISRLIPPYTFYSQKYKENGKDYCKPLPSFTSFDKLYSQLVGRPFFGSFTQSHPNDTERNAKWRIPTRYYWVNFINALCYNVNKTIEFRFLRPTYNYEKILIWLLLFNAIIAYAEDLNASVSPHISIKDIVFKSYPPFIAEYIMEGVVKLEALRQMQVQNGDNIGRDVEIENTLFKTE